MNRAVIKSHSSKFKLNIYSYLIWQIQIKDKDFFYGEDHVSVDFPLERNRMNKHTQIFEWWPSIKVTEFENSWKDYAKQLNLNTEETLSLIEDILEGFELIGVRVNEIIKVYKEKSILKKDLSLLKSTSYKMIKEFFDSELHELKQQLLKTSGSQLQSKTDNIKLGFETGLSWKKETEKKLQGYKTNLSELCYVLAQSGMIVKDGKPVTHKYLTSVFNEWFDTDINVNKPTDLIGKRSFNRTFIHDLNEILKKYSNKDPQK